MSARIVGTGITKFGMFTGTNLRTLAAEAVDLALDDAGLDGAEIGLVLFGNAGAGLITGQEMIRAQTSLSTSRVVGRPMLSVENACASSSSAFHLAQQLVNAGTYDFIMVVGAEKMTAEDRTLASKALATAVDVEASSTEDSDGAPRPVFMEIYAANTRAYMERSGATSEDFARIAAKSTQLGSLNPIAQITTPKTVEEVLADRMIVAPLTRAMCAGIGDGAAAVIVCSDEVAEKRGLSGPRVRASVINSNAPDVGKLIVPQAAQLAYDAGGVGPEDIDVVELHDAASPAEMFIAEELGLAAPDGGAVELVRNGDTELGGRIPINPSGGLTARGHPVGATGVAQIVELADQLRGRAGARQVDGAKLAMAQNAGGSIFGGEAVCAITILES